MVKHVPNLLSVFRVFDLVIVVWLLENNYKIWAFVFFVIGVLSDVLDGHIARKSKSITKIGKILDPLADKVLVIGVLISLIKIMDIPYWMVIVIVFREFAVTGLRVVAASESVVISANVWGKLKTTSQFIALALLILGYKEIGVYMLFVAVVMTVVSGYIYYKEYFKDKDVFA
ncbi:CDP-diacylglycerol--glycerol-3-phosphate 3-phosphatidyltransferase [Hippea maritima]|uniref:CDP-diacylglycerol--glycerol-3-phosphate 3-phosphatidyltransferase n=1 Tax=Hippea maritima (strain ATCC 700847 / DSM 10411 / MH2) TaxID=760142 RepID=F2LTT1_HIPMA|nr:CDP-diacylglycerol--glycerol-3-phosphate 3-phosphatidyltransferase [Hippea maritima]AEA34457.1 CDP-diacylglycerol/glycerol-3-phosphate3-phosphatidyltransferase [Hippea maritima DSM 10411]